MGFGQTAVPADDSILKHSNNRNKKVSKTKKKKKNMLSRLVIAFLLRSKCLNFMTAVTICSDFGAPQNKVSHYFHCFPIYSPVSVM